MSKYVKYCPGCAINNDMPTAKYHVPGYIDYYEDEKLTICPRCGSEFKQLNMLSDDYSVLTRISTDPKFMEAMVQLHDSNIIEYEARMSQFRTQVDQQKQQKERQQSGKPQCPYCQSNNVKKIGVIGRSMSIGVFGLGSSKIGKQFHCNNCCADF